MHALGYLLTVLESLLALSWHAGHRYVTSPVALPIFFRICFHLSWRTVTKAGCRHQPQRWSHPRWEAQSYLLLVLVLTTGWFLFLHNEDVADIYNLLESPYPSLAELLPRQLFLIQCLHSWEVLLQRSHLALVLHSLIFQVLSNMSRSLWIHLKPFSLFVVFSNWVPSAHWIDSLEVHQVSMNFQRNSLWFWISSTIFSIL